ncbi:hypothetical protein GJ496_008466 [Pomphorhynchus laevis]|nr:hypothetical protein GJ496_008466 [Pomphorhynchus laevis]
METVNSSSLKSVAELCQCCIQRTPLRKTWDVRAAMRRRIQLWRTTQLEELFKEAEYLQILQNIDKVRKNKERNTSAVCTIDPEVNTTEVLKLNNELNGRTSRIIPAELHSIDRPKITVLVVLASAASSTRNQQNRETHDKEYENVPTLIINTSILSTSLTYLNLSSYIH